MRTYFFPLFFYCFIIFDAAIYLTKLCAYRVQRMGRMEKRHDGVRVVGRDDFRV